MSAVNTYMYIEYVCCAAVYKHRVRLYTDIFNILVRAHSGIKLNFIGRIAFLSRSRPN
jgi:hypothetical protein